MTDKHKNTTTKADRLPKDIQKLADEEAVTVTSDTKLSSKGSDNPEETRRNAVEKGFEDFGAHRAKQKGKPGPENSPEDKDWIEKQQRIV